MIKHFAIVAAALGAAASVHAAPIFSFEGGIEGFSITTNGGGDTVAASGTGATDGTGSLAYAFKGYGNAGSGSVTAAEWTEIYDNRKVAFDYTLTSANPNGWLQFNVAVQSSNSGWANPGSWKAAATSAGTHTAEFDLTGITMAQDPGASRQFFIMHNTGGTPITVYIDNIRVIPVPEPASLGLLAGGSLLLVRRRRA